MAGVNDNWLAREVTLKEGKKKSQSVAQVKETIKLVREKLFSFTDPEIVQWVRRKR